VFNSVERREVKCGVVPVENSIEGSVHETYDSLVTTSAKISGEILLRVVHCLVALPLTSMDDVKVVYSHPQALAQCRGFLTSLGAEVKATYDTAGSVKKVRDEGRRDAAAVASKEAALIYGMHVLNEGIEDNKNNYTRFLVVATEESERLPESKTSVIFSTQHAPGSLYAALEPFARHGVNLTKIESRPTRQRPWEYYFFLDFEGHRDDAAQKIALEDLAKRTISLKILGSYQRARIEQQE
jgi:prephenate dehydratase